MYALRFKFKEEGDNSQETFNSLLCDLIASHRMGFPILRTQIYYPDSSDLGAVLPNEFMIEVVNEDNLLALQRFLLNRSDVKNNSILAWDPKVAMSPQQAGMWCHTYHAGTLRLSPTSAKASYSRR